MQIERGKITTWPADATPDQIAKAAVKTKPSDVDAALSRSAQDKIAKAKTRLILHHPFFAAVILKTPFVETLSIPTAGVDGKRLYYNPEFFNSLSLDHALFILAHEALHVCNAHHARMQHRDPRKWNIATDYQINSILKESGFSLADKALLDPQYDGLSSEITYDRLPDDQGGDDGDGDQFDPGGCGGVIPMPADATPDQIAKAIERGKITTWQAMQAAKAQGKLPAAVETEFSDLFEPAIRWQDVLRQFMETITRNDYTWSRPNRRYSSQGIILPSLYSHDCGPIVVAGDASGSVSDQLFKMFLSELGGMLVDARPEFIQWLCWEMSVTDERRLEPNDLPITVNRAGYGGTDVQCVFDWILEHDLEPECVIVLSDMYFIEPDPRGLDCPVLWVAPEGQHSDPPSWGELIELPPEGCA